MKAKTRMPSKKQLYDRVKGKAGKWCRDSGVCVASGNRFSKCGCSNVLQWCHIVRQKDYDFLKFDPDNFVPMCSAHHTFFTRRPEEWRQFIDERCGDKHVPVLLARDKEIFRSGATWREVWEKWEAWYDKRPVGETWIRWRNSRSRRRGK